MKVHFRNDKFESSQKKINLPKKNQFSLCMKY